jgi:hypothetical protein
MDFVPINSNSILNVLGMGFRLDGFDKNIAAILSPS